MPFHAMTKAASLVECRLVTLNARRRLHDVKRHYFQPFPAPL
jgi:hypothetical protein